MSTATRSQAYSDIVFKSVQNYVGQAKDDEQKKYKALCKRSGGLLRTIGLIQYLTYVESKGEKEGHYKVLIEHLRAEISKTTSLSSSDSANFLKTVREQNLPDYMQSTKNVLRLLQWHKRIADILIEGNCEEND